MTGDDDIRAILPNSPPPAPKQREAAIAAALARFDGNDAPSLQPRTKPAGWWRNLRRPQAALIAATLLAVTISVPFALQSPVPFAPSASDQTSPTNIAGTSAGQSRLSETAEEPASSAPSQKPNAVSLDEPSVQQDASLQAAETVNMVPAVPVMPTAAAPAPPAAPPRPAPSVMAANEATNMLVQGRTEAKSARDLQAAIASSDDDARDESSVVVTGSRVSRSRSPERGNWNACTVNDPDRRLARCRKLADRAPTALRNQVESYLSDGLNQAWNGELEEAIAAFDAAIKVAPDLPAAYLNRGLLYDRQGKSAAAIADLNLAVRLSPKSARAYYNRSILLRKYGEAKRARADELQAVKLDVRYNDMIR